MANRVDPDQTAPSMLFASIASNVRQLFEADDLFRCIFLGALRVNMYNIRNLVFMDQLS